MSESLMLFDIQTSLICLGIHAAITWEGMPLNIIPNTLDKILDPPSQRIGRMIVNFLEKPLYACLSCMGGIWTVIHYIVLEGALEWLIVPHIFVVIGFNSLIALIIRVIDILEIKLF